MALTPTSCRLVPMRTTRRTRTRVPRWNDLPSGLTPRSRHRCRRSVAYTARRPLLRPLSQAARVLCPVPRRASGGSLYGAPQAHWGRVQPCDVFPVLRCLRLLTDAALMAGVPGTDTSPYHSWPIHHIGVPRRCCGTRVAPASALGSRSACGPGFGLARGCGWRAPARPGLPAGPPARMG